MKDACNKLLFTLMSHICYLKSLKNETQLVLNQLKNSESGNIPEIENRERLINLTKSLQFKILKIINENPALYIEFKPIINSWSTDSKNVYDAILILDEQLQNLFAQEKEKTQSQLNRTYKTRQVLKSYSLNDVK